MESVGKGVLCRRDPRRDGRDFGRFRSTSRPRGQRQLHRMYPYRRLPSSQAPSTPRHACAAIEWYVLEQISATTPLRRYEPGRIEE